MPFKKSLEKIRQKPAHVKERIVTVWMVFFGLGVVATWYFTMDFSRMRFSDTKNVIETTKDSFSNSGTLFDSKLPETFVDDETAKSLEAASSTSSSTIESNTATTTVLLDENTATATDATTTDNY